MTTMQIIAHRGNSSACHENTMPAFERAIAETVAWYKRVTGGEAARAVSTAQIAAFMEA